MADKPVGTDLVTKLNAANMQPLWDMVWDGLGESPVPTNVRVHIQAQPIAPSDGTNYVARDGGWVAQDPQDIAAALAGKLDIAGGTIQGTLRVNGTATFDSPVTVPAGATGNQVARVSDIISLLHPVGSIWITAAATDPSLQFPGTTWQQISQGRVLIGAGTLDSDVYVAGDEGGEARHTLTVQEIPGHTHSYTDSVSQFLGAGLGDWGSAGDVYRDTFVARTTEGTGGGQAHENRMPYLAVNIWQRIS